MSSSSMNCSTRGARNVNLHREKSLCSHAEEGPILQLSSVASQRHPHGMHCRHGCQMAIARFLDSMCLALRACGLWLRYATLQNLIPSFPWIAPPRPPPWHNPRKGRDQILPSGNPALSLSLSLRFCFHTPQFLASLFEGKECTKTRLDFH